MTTTDITNLMHTYYDWLRDKTAVTAIDGEWSVITTPYLDRHNDYLQLYVRPTLTGGLELSDDCTDDTFLQIRLAVEGIDDPIGLLEIDRHGVDRKITPRCVVFKSRVRKVHFCQPTVGLHVFSERGDFNRPPRHD